MAKVECSNCKRTTPVVSPKYRCIYCNYPLHKYQESEEKQLEETVIKDFKQNDDSMSIVDQMRAKREELGKPEAKKVEPIVPKVEPPKEEVELKTEKPKKSVIEVLSDKLKGKKVENDIFKEEEKIVEPKKDLNEMYSKSSQEVRDRVNVFQKLFGDDKEKEAKPEPKVEPPKPEPIEVEKIEFKKEPIIETKVEPKIESTVEKVTVIRHEPVVQKVESRVYETPAPRPATDVVIRKNENPNKVGKIVAGWLVVHTEDRAPVMYELFEGNNVIGRPDGSHHVDVKVEGDKAVSRIHCSVVVKKDFLHRFVYVLQDGGGLPESKSSTNGTYINGFEQRLDKGSKVYLRDGDTVQVGETKLAFKNTDESDNHRQAASSVISSDYTKTVAINYKPR